MVPEPHGDVRAREHAYELADTAHVALDHDDWPLALITALAAVRAVPVGQPAPLAVLRAVRRVIERTRPQCAEFIGSDNGGCTAWHPSDHLLAIANDMNWIRLWDIESDQIVQTFGPWPSLLPADLPPDSPDAILASSSLTAMRWSTDGTTLLTLHERSTPMDPVESDVDAAAEYTPLLPCRAAVLWDVSNGQLRQFLVGSHHPQDPSDPQQDIAWSADGSRLLIAHRDHAQLWDAHQGTLLFELRNLAPAYHTIIPSPDARMVAVVCGTELSIWDAPTGALLREIACPDLHIVTVRWSADSAGLLTSTGTWATNDPIPDTHQHVRLWDAATGIQIHSFPGAEGVLSPSGRWVLTIGEQNLIRIWESTTGQLQQSFQSSMDVRAYTLCWSPDERSVLASGDSEVQVWDVATGTQTARLPCPFPLSVDWSLDSRMVAVVNAYHSRFLVWTLSGRQPLRQYRPCPEGVYGLRWGSDGIRLLTHTLSVRAVNPARAQILAQAQLPYGLRTLEAVMCPDQRHVLIAAQPYDTGSSGGDGQRVPQLQWFDWDTTTNTMRNISIGVEQGDLAAWSALASISFSPDGRHYAIAATTAIVLNDTTTHATIQRLTLASTHRSTTQLTWGPDNLLIAVQHERGHQPDHERLQMQMWDVLRRQLVHETTLSVGNISQICGIGWGRTGPQLFVNVYRQSPYLPVTPEVWDLMRGTMLAAPALPALQLHRATWSPTGQHLVAIGERVAWVIESASGTVVDSIESPVMWGAAFAWSPDGDQLLLTGRWQGELPLLTQVIDPALLRAELTRRVGECGRSPFRMIEPEPRTLEEHIRQYIPDWRGIEIELSVVADLLARYDRIAAS